MAGEVASFMVRNVPVDVLRQISVLAASAGMSRERYVLALLTAHARGDGSDGAVVREALRLQIAAMRRELDAIETQVSNQLERGQVNAQVEPFSNEQRAALFANWLATQPQRVEPDQSGEGVVHDWRDGFDVE